MYHTLLPFQNFGVITRDDRVLHEGLVMHDVAVGEDDVAVLADLDRSHPVVDTHDARGDERDGLQRGFSRQPAAYREASLDR